MFNRPLGKGPALGTLTPIIKVSPDLKKVAIVRHERSNANGVAENEVRTERKYGGRTLARAAQGVVRIVGI